MSEFSITVTVSNIPHDAEGLKLALHQVITYFAEKSEVQVVITDAEEADETLAQQRDDLLAAAKEANDFIGQLAKLLDEFGHDTAKRFTAWDRLEAAIAGASTVEPADETPA